LPFSTRRQTKRMVLPPEVGEIRKTGFMEGASQWPTEADLRRARPIASIAPNSCITPLAA
jgi:hypothetical protein